MDSEIKRVEINNDYIVGALNTILDATNPDNVACLHPDFVSAVDITALSYEHMRIAVEKLIKDIEIGYTYVEC